MKKQIVLSFMAMLFVATAMAQPKAAMVHFDRMAQRMKAQKMTMTMPDLTKLDRSMVKMDYSQPVPRKRLNIAAPATVVRKAEAKVDSFACYFNQTALCDGLPLFDNMYASRVYATADSVYVPTTLVGGGFLPAKRVGKATAEDADSIIIQTGLLMAAYSDGEKTVNAYLCATEYDAQYNIVSVKKDYIGGYYFPEDGTVSLVDGVGAVVNDNLLTDAVIEFYTLPMDMVDQTMMYAATSFTSMSMKDDYTYRSVVANLGNYLFVAQLDPVAAHMGAGTWLMLYADPNDQAGDTYILPFLQLTGMYNPRDDNGNVTASYFMTNIGMPTVQTGKMNYSYCQMNSVDGVREDGSVTYSFVPMDPTLGTDMVYCDIILTEESYQPAEGTNNLAFTVIPEFVHNGIDGVSEGATRVLSSDSFDLQGRRVSADHTGLTIVKQRMADGTVKSRKVIRK